MASSVDEGMFGKYFSYLGSPPSHTTLLFFRGIRLRHFIIIEIHNVIVPVTTIIIVRVGIESERLVNLT